MKKRRLKKWVKELLILVVISLLAVGFVFIASARAEQIDRSMNYVEIN